MLGLLFALSSSPTLAQAPSPPVTAPIGDIQLVIERQLRAFRDHDAAGAWGVVAPDLQRQFGTAERFLEMVRTAYGPVYDPATYEFGALQAVPGGVGQWMEFIDRNGRSHRAIYLMEKQADGTWRTMGCLMVEEGPATPQA